VYHLISGHLSLPEPS